MGPVTVAHLLYIFLHNWNHSQPLEEEGVSRMFQGTMWDLLRCASGRVRLCFRKKTPHFETLEHDNKKEYLISAGRITCSMVVAE